MKYIIILLLALLIVKNEDITGRYSIRPFIKELQESGYYELINGVKCELTTDVAIEVCEILTESPYCEEVVRVFMTCNKSVRPTTNPDAILISILNSYKIPLDKFKKLIYALRNKNKNKNEELDVNSSKY